MCQFEILSTENYLDFPCCFLDIRFFLSPKKKQPKLQLPASIVWYNWSIRAKELHCFKNKSEPVNAHCSAKCVSIHSGK